MLEATLNVELDEVKVQIGGIINRLHGGLGADWAGPAVAFEISYILRELFESEGRGNWMPLAPSTVRERESQGFGGAHPILRRTNRLFNSLTDPRGRGAGDSVIRMSPFELQYGTEVDYAIYHMKGTRNMPARPPIELSPVDIDRIQKVYADYVITDGRNPQSVGPKAS